MAQDLWNVISNGGTLGAVTFAILAGFFYLWKNVWKRGDIANEKKTLIAVATPIVIVNAIYFFGLFAGFWEGSWDAWWKAMQVATAEVAGSHALRGGLGLLEKAVEPERKAKRNRKTADKARKLAAAKGGK